METKPSSNDEHQTKTESPPTSNNVAATAEEALATFASMPTQHEACVSGGPTSALVGNEGGGGGVAAAAAPPPPPPPVVLPFKKTRSDFRFGKCIGDGSFSTVHLAIDMHSRREYAVKICDKRHILRERKQEYVRREREVLQIMTNVPGFVKLMCTFQDTRSLYFVMTYAHNGELLPHIKRVGCFSLDCARHYAAELVLACEQMHRRGVVHRDLKPENILLDKHMHTLIADFGSAKVLNTEDINAAIKLLSTKTSGTSLRSTEHLEDLDSDELESDPSYDDIDAFYRPKPYCSRRKGSFVGTAQYVSPEVLQNVPISPAADLWALGCILYQMISGLPPFRGYNDFAIFKEILALNLDFPENFDKSAADLVKRLLKHNANERLGAEDNLSHDSRYNSIRRHEFFAGIDFDTVREKIPPKIFPYLPSFHAKDTDCEISRTSVVSSLETDLLDKMLNLGILRHIDNKFDCEADEKKRLIEEQKLDKWLPFADNEIILLKGLVYKHKGLFPSKRMLILTTGPHLIYVDPIEMIKAGEIPWGRELRGEIGNNKMFFLHTTDRTYFFDCLEGSAQEWVTAIERVHQLAYKEPNQAGGQSSSSAGGGGGGGVVVHEEMLKCSI